MMDLQHKSTPKKIDIIVKIIDGVGTRLGASSISVNPELINTV